MMHNFGISCLLKPRHEPPAVPPASLVSHLRTARRIVVLTGAGTSAESGIPTFRDQGSGLWSRFDPQALATPEAFRRDPKRCGPGTSGGAAMRRLPFRMRAISR